MTSDHAASAVLGGAALLERAVGYALGSLHLVGPGALGRPTPCREWDLRALLTHLADSLTVLRTALADGAIAPLDPDPWPAGRADPVAVCRTRAAALLGTCADTLRNRRVAVSDRVVTAAVVAGVGAVEVAVHGWDVARACGQDRPLPAAFADELLDLAPLLVTAVDRPARFARVVPVPAGSDAPDRLLAFLGRDPAGPLVDRRTAS